MLGMYGLKVTPEEHTSCDHLEDKNFWRRQGTDRSIVPVNKQFTKIILKQVTDFTKVASEFFTKFKEEGPVQWGRFGPWTVDPKIL